MAPQEEGACPPAQPRKHVRLNSDEEILGDEVGGDADALSDHSAGMELDYHLDRPGRGAKFSEKLIEQYQSPWQPSATPKFLQHRFMVRMIKLIFTGRLLIIHARSTILWV